MRKLTYIFLLGAVFVFFAGCLKNSEPIAGPTGAIGSQGSPGSNFSYIRTTLALETPFFNALGTNYYYEQFVFSGYNPKITYMFSAYVARVDALGKEGWWYKLPYNNIFVSGDELYATLKHDTLTILYNGGGATWPSDSNMNCEIVIVPQQ